MWRRLNREDLLGSNPLLAAERHQVEFTWRVYEDYELVEEEGPDPYFVAAEDANISKEYVPLVETPHLFLEFARLHEQKDADQALREWIGKFGLLGLHKDRWPGASPSSSEVHWYWGGPRETLAAVRAEVSQANLALTKYEAALSGDVEKLEQAYRIRGSSPRARRGQQYFRNRAESVGATYTDVLVDSATSFTISAIHKVLREFAFPRVYYRFSGASRSKAEPSLLKPELLRASLGPRNLLGAMYIQFYWLVTSAGELSHCRYCGRIISYSPPIPGVGERKPRKDKVFCDNRCRENYHYHNRIKPQRSQRA